MKISVITACTARKGKKPAIAEELYLGDGHRRLMEGVRDARGRGILVDVWVVSALHGFIPGDSQIAPYNRTFTGMTKAERRDFAGEHGVPDAFRRAADASDLAIVGVGETYAEVLDLPSWRPAVPAIVIGGPSHSLFGNLAVVPANNKMAARLRCGTVALKGEITRRILSVIGTSDPRSALALAEGLLDSN